MPIHTQFPITLFTATKLTEQTVEWLLRDEFTIDEAAPITSPRTAEPGPGTLTAFDPAGSNIKIVGGRLSLTGRNLWDDTGVLSNETFQRAPGLTLYGRYHRTGSASCPFVFGQNTGSLTRVGSGWSLGNTLTASGVGTYDILGDLNLNTRFYDMFTILRNAGAYFVFSDDMGRWLLGCVEAAATHNPVRPSLSVFHSQEQQVDDLSVFQADEWADESAIYTEKIASPANGQVIATEAQTLLEFAWTPGASEVMDVQIRRVDDDNCWIVRCDQSGGTVKLYEKLAGAETERATSVQAWSIGSSYRLHLIALDDAIRVSVNNSNKISYTSAQFQHNASGAKVSGFSAGSNLISWPMELDRKRPELLTTIKRVVGSRASHIRLADMPVRVEQAGLEALDGKIYLVAGADDSPDGHSEAAFGYDPTTDSWSQIADLPIACQSAVLRAVSGKLYHIGGYHSQTVTMYNHVYEYDPVSNTWTRKTDMPTPREDMGSAVINGKIHVFGGNYPSHNPNDVHEVYDPATDTWDTKASLPEDKWSSDFGAALNGKAYAICSSDTFAGYPATVSPTPHVFEYDPVSNTWAQKADCPFPTQYREVEPLNGKIYVVGGVTGTMHNATDRIYSFDPVANTWEFVGHGPCQVHGPSLASLNGHLYMAGGDVYLSSAFNCFYRLTL